MRKRAGEHCSEGELGGGGSIASLCSEGELGGGGVHSLPL